MRKCVLVFVDSFSPLALNWRADRLLPRATGREAESGGVTRLQRLFLSDFPGQSCSREMGQTPRTHRGVLMREKMTETGEWD